MHLLHMCMFILCIFGFVYTCTSINKTKKSLSQTKYRYRRIKYLLFNFTRHHKNSQKSTFFGPILSIKSMSRLCLRRMGPRPRPKFSTSRRFSISPSQIGLEHSASSGSSFGTCKYLLALPRNQYF